MLEKFFKSLNPMEMLQEWILEICRNVLLSSYQICLIAGVVGLLLYVFGYKKGQTIAILSPVVYLIIRIIGGAILSV